MANSYILVEKDLEDFKKQPIVKKFLDEENKSGSKVSNDRLFIAMVMWAFFFDNSINGIDDFRRKIWDNIVDGANDTGIDFICLYEGIDDSKHLAIGQVKYRSAKPRPFEDIVDPFIKEVKGYKDYYDNKSDPNTKVKEAFERVEDELEGDEPDATEFWTFWAGERPDDIDQKLSDAWDSNRPKGKTYEKKNVRWSEEFACDGGAIHRRIDDNQNSSKPIAEDFLKIDSVDNVLHYFPFKSADTDDCVLIESDALITNISAVSLRKLYKNYKDRLLSLNLRFHVTDNKVDKPIDETIEKTPEDFWYLNNGITIVCDNYKLDEAQRRINLYNFSIINGGQTTNRIGNSSIGRPGDAFVDFYLPCKVIRLRGKERGEKENFADRVAKATNTQKPIKPQDLRANSSEQRDLQREARKLFYFYAIKRGEKNERGFELATKLDEALKTLAAGILQIPGTSRSSGAKLYKDEFYDPLFLPPTKAIKDYEGVDSGYSAQIASLLKDFVWINKYYKDALHDLRKSHDGGEHFESKDLSGSDDVFMNIVKNARTLVLALSGLCSRVAQGYLKMSDYNSVKGKDVNSKFANLNPDWKHVLPHLWVERKDESDNVVGYDVDPTTKNRFTDFVYDVFKTIKSKYKSYVRNEGKAGSPVTDIMKKDEFYRFLLSDADQDIWDWSKEYKDIFA